MSQTLSSKQLHALCDAAMQAAREAGQWIENFDRINLKRTFKDAGSSQASQLVTEVDIGSEAIIRQRLQKISAPLDIAFVGEESSLNTHTDAQERFEKPFFWCVDPLDGTLPFTEGRPGYAVSIALVEQSGAPLIGVVYDPVTSVTYHAIKGKGAFRDMAPFKQTRLSQPNHPPNTLIVYADASFKTHPKYQPTVDTLEKCAQTLGVDSVAFVYGSGAVKNACGVLESSHACYVKLPKKADGGGSIWDYAATACIAHESGGWASDINGRPLALNQRHSTFMNQEGVIFASNRQLAHCLLGAL